jgi:glutamate-1-semialdehyde aminotransferase/aryl-alcohol dehydrogenase-like predicted oxidoreductase
MFFPKNKIIIGAANFGANYGFAGNSKNINLKKVKKIVTLCEGYGINKIDTAMGYANSEKIIGNLKNDLKIITKFPYIPGSRNNIKKEIILRVNNSLKKLKSKKIHTLIMHDPEQLLSQNGKVIYETLLDLKSKNIVEKIGISVYDESTLLKIVSLYNIDVVQFPCNYLNRTFLSRDLILKLKKKNIEIHARSIFLMGFLLNNNFKNNQYLKKWSKTFEAINKWHVENKISKLESCLSFIASKKYIDGFIIGIDNLSQVKDILKIKKLKKPNFFFPAMKDLNLIDTRLWKQNKILKNNKSLALWNKASKTILGGNMIFSKRPDLFLPNKWPTYFSKSKGCKIWDISGKSFHDMSLMGIGTNILGYNAQKVDNAVKNVIKLGNLTTLNCPEEVELSEKLIQLHPWADMAKLARTGGEASSVSIRIARAVTGKDNIAFCGYHGWHDWYLSANLSNSNKLNEHLLPGLSARGVASNLKNTVFPFLYNDLEGLKKIISQKNIGTVKMEVCRNELPKNNFLKKIRDLCTKEGIVLIFDECSSGFRQSNGGLHKIYNVNPDIATFGKALGNGYPITAIIGKKEVMEAAQESFISSTFWSDRIGPTAALATLAEMAKIKSWNIITKKGNYLRKKWTSMAKKYNLNLKLYGIPALSAFIVDSPRFLEYKTFITQEMLKKKFLASNSVYLSIAHEKKIIDSYLYELDKIFKIIGECEQGRNIYSLLESPVCISGFKRLN